MFVEVSSSARASAGPEPSVSTRKATATDQKAERGKFSWGKVTPYLFILPGVVLLCVWTYSPLVQTFGLSFYDWNLIQTSPKTYVGMENYEYVLGLPELHDAVSNTLVYIAAFFMFSLVLPIVIGLLARQVRGRAKTIYQALIFVPFLITPVASGAVWRWILADGGLMTEVAGNFGIAAPNVLREPSLAIWAIILVVGWQMLGFGVLIVAAGFAGISPEYAQAASLEGASGWRILWRITMPLLSPTLVFLSLMTILLSAQWSFPIIDLLTQGGPGDSTTNVYYILYQFGFQNFDSGTSSAAGVIFFLAFAAIAVIFLQLQERLSFYDN